MNAFKSYALLLLVLITVAEGYAQRKSRRTIPDNLPKFDERLFHFGFQLGISNNNFILEPDLTATDSLVTLNHRAEPGFNVYVVSEMHLTPNFSLRFTPGIAFADRYLDYTFDTPGFENNILVDKLIESTYIDVPLDFKFRSNRANNFASYILAGFRYSIDLASQQNTDNKFNAQGEYIVKLKRNTYNVDLGVGFDFFLEYFKFSPEIRYTFGVNDLIVKDQTPFSNPINNLRSRIWVLSFNFEG